VYKFGEKSWLNVRTIRVVFLLLEEVSGLKVNFNKSMLTGVNISSSWLSEAASVLNCRTSMIPFVYLGGYVLEEMIGNLVLE
jgi:hypothetical protein